MGGPFLFVREQGSFVRPVLHSLQRTLPLSSHSVSCLWCLGRPRTGGGLLGSHGWGEVVPG